MATKGNITGDVNAGLPRADNGSGLHGGYWMQLDYTYTGGNIDLIRFFVTSDLPVLVPIQSKNKLLLAYITVLILYGSIFANNSLHPV